MRAYTLTHLSDAALIRDLAALVAQDRTNTASMLAHIAEVDARRLYAPAGYPSMYAYCVGELRLSEEAAFKRIHAARTARRFPAIFAALADGRLHLSAVIMLAPYLTEGTADELLKAASHKTKPEIEQLLAERFPRPELPTQIQAVAGPRVPGALGDPVNEHAPGRVQLTNAPQVRVEPPKVARVSPERFVVQLTIDRVTHDKLRYAQELLSHALPSGDVAQVLDRALDALIGQLERRKFAATSKPRPRQQTSTRERYIPAHVKRAVWERDQGRCTFVSENGHRCQARKSIEFDHVDPVARGGEATVERMRLRCRAHNQYGAECTFGSDFMDAKRNEARCMAAEARERAAVAAEARSRL